MTSCSLLFFWTCNFLNTFVVTLKNTEKNTEISECDCWHWIYIRVKTWICNFPRTVYDCMSFWYCASLKSCSLAGVSRSVTLVVAYIMTVTKLGWSDALAAVKVARPCAAPNLGFQQQLQEFESTQADQVWGGQVKLDHWGLFGFF